MNLIMDIEIEMKLEFVILYLENVGYNMRFEFLQYCEGGIIVIVVIY